MYIQGDHPSVVTTASDMFLPHLSPSGGGVNGRGGGGGGSGGERAGEGVWESGLCALLASQKEAQGGARRGRESSGTADAEFLVAVDP